MRHIDPALNTALTALALVIPGVEVERIERNGSVVVRTPSKRLLMSLAAGTVRFNGYDLADENFLVSGTYFSSGWSISTMRVSRQTRRNLRSALPR